MPRCKIVFIGGGSFHWGPGIIRDFIVSPELQGSTLVLQDINHEAAETNRIIAEHIKAKAGADLSIEVVDDRAAALQDADYVVVAIAAGGLEAWRLDMEIPDKHGVRQTIADTVGPGGLSRGLRTIPVMLDIARDMERICPDAWLLNVTNPMTTLTRAVWKETGIRCIGLCHEVIGCLHDLAKMLDVPAEDLHYNFSGLNHCVWITELTVRGQDGLEMVRRHWRKDGYPKDTVAPLLFEIFGALPVWKGRHLSEFFPHFLTPETGYGEKYGFLDQMVTVKDRYASRAKEHKRWLEEMREGRKLPGLELGDEPIVPIIIALEGGPSGTFLVNWPNLGQVSNFPLDVVVETKGVVDARGVSPIAAGPLPTGIHAVLMRHADNQELIVEAAVKGDRQLALQAMFNDPLVKDLEAAKAILDELLAAHAEHLPQFKS
jgi:alpha-galactosidase